MSETNASAFEAAYVCECGARLAKWDCHREGGSVNGVYCAARIRDITMPDIIGRFRAYHDVRITWGSLHTVLDDNNRNDDSVRGCIEYAQQTGDVEGEALARMLLTMSKTQRRKISRLA